MKVTDLTHIISSDMPVFPGTEQPIFEKAHTLEIDGFRDTKFTMYSHTGTHIDIDIDIDIDAAARYSSLAYPSKNQYLVFMRPAGFSSK